MTNRFSIILSFLFATVLAVGGVEWFYGTIKTSLSGKQEVIQAKPDHGGQTRAGSPASGPAPSPLQKTVDTQRKEDYSIITKRSLFGRVAGETAPQETPQEPKAAPTPTSLDLVLLGTISGSSNEQRAIIRDKKKGKQDIYYRGDPIKHALIKEIKRGQIILDVNGKEEVLLMQESKSPKGPGPVSKGKKNNKPETYTLADVIEEEEKKTKRPPPRRKTPPNPKKDTLKIDLNQQENPQED